ncbi:OmpA family protein [Ferruginibacter albus]|uniref:OmpA family protein n=1 Tax=Ferruginibacter albus TaxID=2875540 RepID=UPI001CC81DFB|nr:OmpA family protein [Ferruginibacter albus]UAY51741.1 OmpA family protein [Ferruginibacter albus]
MKKKSFKLLLLIFHVTLFTLHTNAQWYDPDKVNKKVGDLYAQGVQEAQYGNYAEALTWINKAIAIDKKFVDGYLSRAGIYSALKNYRSSMTDFETAFKLDSVYTYEYHLPYSISLAGDGQFERALEAVNIFLRSDKINEQSIKAGNYRKRTYEFAIDYKKKHSDNNYVFAPKNLGDSVNTKFAEYWPSITVDGKRLVFTRRLRDADEDFFESDLINGTWSNATSLSGKVNTNLNEGAQNISQDGEWLVFTGCNYPEGYGSCDLYISHKTKDGWSEGQNLGPAINTDAWETSPSLSPDKKDLYFASNRRGGYGKSDIWVTHHLANGDWSAPENLGSGINTEGDEGCPFMYADNQTLFFSSNNWDGYGSTDLFYSKKLNDTTWSTPQNLGYPINTIDDEGSLIVAADGKTAYYASDRSDSKGQLDIYSFDLREDIRPPKTLWVKGKVFDAKTKAGLPSSVQLTDIVTRQIISDVQTNEVGDYLATLPVGKDYAFNVNRKGYLFYSSNYNININTTDSFFTADIPLQPIEAGAKIILNNIFFDSKQSTLKSGSLIELDKVVQLMDDNPKLVILISGYTDNVGKDADNLKLSNDRALAVVNYLLSSKKIAKERLQYKGFGASNPIADNTTEEGKAQNRRTELTVISN